MQYSLYEKKKTRIPSPRNDEKLRALKKYIYASFSILILIISIFLIIRIWPKKPEIKVILGTEGEVVFDGESIGTGTEFTLRKLEKGLHTIVAKSTEEIPFLLEEVEEINIQPGVKTELKMLSVCELNINSNPPGARVMISSIEGELNLGKTPIHTKIQSGHFEVNVRLPGYPEYRKSILTVDLEPVDLNIDLEQLALSEPGAKRLINNLTIKSMMHGSSFVIDGKTYAKAGSFAVEPGIHKTSLVYGKNEVFKTEIVFPSVGKPVVLSCPSNTTYPCVHFSNNLHVIPQDARDLTLSNDEKYLFYTTPTRNIYETVKSVDLETGETGWVVDVDSAWENRPVIIGGCSNNSVFGMAGVPPKFSACPFAIDIKHGVENQRYYSENSALPLSEKPIDHLVATAYAGVWNGFYKTSRAVTGVEVLIQSQTTDERFLKILDREWNAKYLGYSESAKDNSKPIFIFHMWKGNSNKLLILDPEKKLSENDLKKNPKEKNPEWVTIDILIHPDSLVSESHKIPAKSILICGGNNTHAISYPSGKIIWKRYFNIPPIEKPSFKIVKDKPVVLYTFNANPFEVLLDIKTGKEIDRREKPATPEEFFNPDSSKAGIFLKKDKLFSGIYEDSQIGYNYRWEKTIKNGLVFLSEWGAIKISGDTFTVLASHGLEEILSFKVVGFDASFPFEYISTPKHIAIHSNNKCWVINRDGLIVGFYQGISKIEKINGSSVFAFLATSNKQRFIVPWTD
ncbi:MAG: PEGA domain-containing protein [Caldisericia bacterium]